MPSWTSSREESGRTTRTPLQGLPSVRHASDQQLRDTPIISTLHADESFIPWPPAPMSIGTWLLLLLLEISIQL